MCTALALQIKDVLQVLDLFLQLGHKSVVGCTDLVRTDFGHDLFGPVSELKRRNSLLGVINHRAHSSYQSSARVTPKTVLEQSRDLRVTVGYMCPAFALGERLNDFAERAQTQVNRLKLKQVVVAHHVFLVNFFASSQVTEVKFATHEHPSCVWLI